MESQKNSGSNFAELCFLLTQVIHYLLQMIHYLQEENHRLKCELEDRDWMALQDKCGEVRSLADLIYSRDEDYLD